MTVPLPVAVQVLDWANAAETESWSDATASAARVRLVKRDVITTLSCKTRENAMEGQSRAILQEFGCICSKNDRASLSLTDKVSNGQAGSIERPFGNRLAEGPRRVSKKTTAMAHTPYESRPPRRR